MAEIIRDLGADIEKIDSNTWKINPKEIVHYAPYELVRKMRASICLLGPLCARLGRAEIPMPGGCVIGNRPIDLHLRALKGLSAKVELKGGVVRIDAKNLKGEGIFSWWSPWKYRNWYCQCNHGCKSRQRHNDSRRLCL